MNWLWKWSFFDLSHFTGLTNIFNNVILFLLRAEPCEVTASEEKASLQDTGGEKTNPCATKGQGNKWICVKYMLASNPQLGCTGVFSSGKMKASF